MTTAGAEILNGDVLAMLATLAPESVHCIVTSPPYWGLRAYAGVAPAIWGGKPDCPHQWTDEMPRPGSEYRDGLGANSTFAGRTDKEAIRKARHSVRSNLAAAATKSDGVLRSQANRNDNNLFDELPAITGGSTCSLCGAWRGLLGSEPLHDCLAWARHEAPCPTCFVCHIRVVFAALWRVLRDDGVVFLNVGDSYATGAGRAFSPGGKGIPQPVPPMQPNRMNLPGLKPKDLCLIPQRLPLALQADGWWVRNELIWHKKSAMPESVRDRCTRNHEQIWLLAKSESYFWDPVAVREGTSQPNNIGKFGSFRKGDTMQSLRHDEFGGMTRTASRNLRTVWTLRPEPCDWAFCKGCSTLFLGADRKRIRDICGACGVPWPSPGTRHAARGTQPDCCPACGDSSTPRKRQCPTCGASDSWVAHYAAFPSDLPRKAILAATSDKGVCPKCGKPWERETEKRIAGESLALPAGSKNAQFLVSRYGAPRLGPGIEDTTETVGWLPACSCDAGEPVPAVVLDPFCGSGTSLIVAAQLGRRAIGIDASADYCQVARDRVRILGIRAARPAPPTDCPLFREPAERPIIGPPCQTANRTNHANEKAE